ncbi:MAG: DUF4126 domain-containing protein [Acidobacteriota bacterium]|nr:DUF4126 domain-containing protein [Acidobacteriota bacterium]
MDAARRVVCFSAGLNVYATVGMLGILSRVHALALPPQLRLLQSWEVIIVCAVLFAAEFAGDKIPIFDLFWNAAHTFVRIPVAALLVYGAAEHLSEGPRLLATLLGASLALATHSGKFAARAAVSHSPEPFSNAALSLGEDGLAAGLTWFATRHPFVAAAIALVLVAIILVVIRYVLRAMRRAFRRIGDAFEKRRATSPA